MVCMRVFLGNPPRALQVAPASVDFISAYTPNLMDRRSVEAKTVWSWAKFGETATVTMGSWGSWASSDPEPIRKHTPAAIRNRKDKFIGKYIEAHPSKCLAKWGRD